MGNKAIIMPDGVGFGDETLSKYDEGTWTPTISFTSGSYTTQTGTYIRVGNLVTLFFHILYNVSTAGTGELRITLPFTQSASGDNGTGTIATCTGASYSGEKPVAEIAASTNYVILTKQNGIAVVREDFSTGFVRVRGSVTMRV